MCFPALLCSPSQPSRKLPRKSRPARSRDLRLDESLKERTIDAIRAALEAAGVEFIAESVGGPGVRLRKAK